MGIFISVAHPTVVSVATGCPSARCGCVSGPQGSSRSGSSPQGGTDPSQGAKGV